jgi:uncharacterized protein YwgA
VIVTRRDWLELFIAFEGAPEGLDPVRLQKGMFLFERETSVPGAQKYDFRPYNYGPMSKQIYDDLDALVAGGLVEQIPVRGQSWTLYRATPAGISRGSEILEQASTLYPAAVQQLFETKASVASVSFEELLTDVYDRYPAMATKSVFRRRT